MSKLQVVAAVILKNSQVLIAKRPEGKHKAGYWEFPGGKIEPGETFKEALFRELKEEINIQVCEAKELTQVEFSYPEKEVCLNFFTVTDFTGEPKALEGQLIRWIDLAALTNYSFPEANIPVVKMLLSSDPLDNFSGVEKSFRI